MRVAGVIPAFALLTAGLTSGVFLPGMAFAQNWMEYENREYGFTINFPKEPEIDDVTYTTASGASLPARIFFAEEGEGRYTITVVDFSARQEEQADAAEHAAEAMRQRGDVVYEVVSDLDEVPSPQFMIVEPDGREMLSTIVFYNNRLYIAEGSVAAGAAPPAQFQQSMMLVHEDGTRPNGGGQNSDRIARQRAYEEQQRQQQQE